MKHLRRLLLVLVATACVLAVIVAGFYGFEDWRGARAWTRAQRQLADAGESLNPADFIPLPVPDEQNLALLPLFARALDYRIDPRTGGLAIGPNRPSDTIFRDMPYGHGGQKPSGLAPGGWEAGQPLSLEVLRQFYARQADFPHPDRPGTPAEDVLCALTKFAPALEEIVAASDRRQARFPVRWTQWPPVAIALPQDGLIQGLVSVLRVRTLAHLGAGQHAEAARELSLAFRLCEAIRPEPTLITHLVVMTCDGLLLQPIWEGLASRRWTADELADLQRSLRAHDLLADYTRALRGERAILLCSWLDGLRQTGNTQELLGASWDDRTDKLESDAQQRAAAFYPRGWLDQNEASVCLAYQELLAGIVDLRARRVAAARLQEQQRQTRAARKLFEPTKILLKISLPVLQSILPRSAWTQTACEQAEVSCALERYFLANGVYPQSLDALMPGFIDRIPVDLVAGGPIHYNLTDDGRYRLYAVGWNGRDDGGTVAWTHAAPNIGVVKPDLYEGDWVWQYRPSEPPTR